MAFSKIDASYLPHRILLVRLASIILCLLLSAQSLWSQQREKTDAEILSALATAYNQSLARKNYGAMKQALDGIIMRREDAWDERKQRCIVAWGLGDWDSLEEDYSALVAHGINQIEFLEQRGLIRWYKGRVDSACEDFMRVRQLSSPECAVPNCTPKFSHLTEALCQGELEKRAALNDDEKALLAEINTLRAKPASYIAAVEEEYAINANILAPREGILLLREVTQTLINTPPLQPLKSALPLILAAKDHVDYLNSHSRYGHRGLNGSLPHERVARYSFHRQAVSENIGYGLKSARMLVVGLLLDDGIQNRGHRMNLLNPQNRSIGIGTAAHPMYPCVCVQVFEETVYPSR